MVSINGYDLEKERHELQARIRALTIEVDELRSCLNLDKWRERYRQEAEERNASLTRDNAILHRRVDELSKEVARLRNQLDAKKTQLVEAEAKLAAEKKDSGSLKCELKRVSAECERLSKENDSLREQTAQSKTLLQETEEKAKAKAKEDARIIEELEKKTASLGGEVEKLKAKNENQANSTNSSKPTSHMHNRKPVIVNSREETDNPQGGQPGHPHHGRTIGTPCGGDMIVYGDDSPLWNDPDYSFDRYVVKVVPIVMTQMHAVTYYIPRFRNRKTGGYKNAECPDNLKDDINPSDDTKALIMYLTYMADMGVKKCHDLIKNLTNGEYAPSTGFINSLPIEFAKKSSAEQAGIYAELLGVHAMHVDGTTIRVGGRQYNVTICVSGGWVLYFFRPRKGYAGVKNTPIENTCAVLIHDHAIEYFAYGSGHQECLEHIKRYLKRSVEQEPDLTWNIKMLDFIKRLMADAKQADAEREARKKENGGDEDPCRTPDSPHARFTEEMIKEYTDEFHSILDIGIREYEKFPAKDWFRDGKNLCTRLKEDPDAYLLFLWDDQVDFDNNDAERAARQIKRKQASCMEFRGFLSVVAYCESKSIIEVLKATNLPVLDALAEIFRREATTDNELTLENEHLLVLKSALESETEIKKRDDRKLAKAEEEKQKADNELSAARESLENIRADRISRLGGESSPDEKEEGWIDKCHSLEHFIYLKDLDIKECRKNINFDEIHRKDIESQIRKTEENIDRLKKKMEKEEQEAKAKTESTPSELPEVDPEVLDAALKERDEARAKLDEAFKNQLAAYSVFANESYVPLPGSKAVRDACGNVLMGDIMKERKEKAGKAKEAVKKAYADTEKAVAVFEAAVKKLDSIKKGYRIRNRKPEGTKKKSGEDVA